MGETTKEKGVLGRQPREKLVGGDKNGKRSGANTEKGVWGDKHEKRGLGETNTEKGGWGETTIKKSRG